MKRVFKSALALCLVMLALSYTPNVKRSESGSSLLKSLQTFRRMVAIEEAWAAASGHAPFTYITTIRSSIGFVMGYADGTASGDFYAQTNCPTQDPAPAFSEDCDDAPPRGGLVKVAADLMNELNTMLANAGVTSCSSIPASGSVALTTSGGGTVNATYKSPSQAVPAGWDDAGQAFTKAILLNITLASTTTLMQAEFTCGKPAVFLKLNMPVGSHAPGYERRINIVSGKKSGVRVADVFITEYHPDNDEVRGAYAISTEIDESTTTFKTKGVLSTFTGNVQNALKINAHGNYTSNEVSVYFKNFVLSNGNAYDDAELAAMSGSSSAAVGTTSQYNVQEDWCQATAYDSWGYPTCKNTIAAQTAGTIIERQGCVDLDNPTASLTSASLCSGLALDNPSAPAIDSAGSFSPTWAISTMQDKIDIGGVEL